MEQPTQPSESLEAIQQYLFKQREDFRQQSWILIFWGWLVLLACVAHYILLTYVKWDLAFLPWPVLMMIGVIVTISNAVTRRRKRGYQTFSGHSVRSVSVAACVLYFSTSFLCVYQDITPMPFMFLITFLLLAAIGGILKFRTLIFGSIIFLAAGLGSVYFDEPTQLLIAVPTIIMGYIIPGYLLRKIE